MHKFVLKKFILLCFCAIISSAQNLNGMIPQIDFQNILDTQNLHFIKIISNCSEKCIESVITMQEQININLLLADQELFNGVTHIENARRILENTYCFCTEINPHFIDVPEYEPKKMLVDGAKIVRDKFLERLKLLTTNTDSGKNTYDLPYPGHPIVMFGNNIETLTEAFADIFDKCNIFSDEEWNNVAVYFEYKKNKMTLFSNVAYYNPRIQPRYIGALDIAAIKAKTQYITDCLQSVISLQKTTRITLSELAKIVNLQESATSNSTNNLNIIRNKFSNLYKYAENTKLRFIHSPISTQEFRYIPDAKMIISKGAEIVRDKLLQRIKLFAGIDQSTLPIPYIDSPIKIMIGTPATMEKTFESIEDALENITFDDNEYSQQEWNNVFPFMMYLYEINNDAVLSQNQ
ncbi:MAG: hypothetical protein IJ730_02850 [Alphaproteobacteria bacterium]|nr:hypothetical protein [Alphaproteobacteria bacterium]